MVGLCVGEIRLFAVRSAESRRWNKIAEKRRAPPPSVAAAGKKKHQTVAAVYNLEWVLKYEEEEEGMNHQLENL